MTDIDDSSARVCPIVKMVQPDAKPTMRIYRVTWYVHNYEPSNNRYHSVKKEKFFETEAAAKRFNEIRKEAAELLGIQEDQNAGHPAALEVENE